MALLLPTLTLFPRPPSTFLWILGSLRCRRLPSPQSVPSPPTLGYRRWSSRGFFVFRFVVGTFWRWPHRQSLGSRSLQPYRLSGRLRREVPDRAGGPHRFRPARPCPATGLGCRPRGGSSRLRPLHPPASSGGCRWILVRAGRRLRRSGLVHVRLRPLESRRCVSKTASLGSSQRLADLDRAFDVAPRHRIGESATFELGSQQLHFSACPFSGAGPSPFFLCSKGGCPLDSLGGPSQEYGLVRSPSRSAVPRPVGAFRRGAAGIVAVPFYPFRRLPSTWPTSTCSACGVSRSWSVWSLRSPVTRTPSSALARRLWGRSPSTVSSRVFPTGRSCSPTGISTSATAPPIWKPSATWVSRPRMWSIGPCSIRSVGLFPNCRAVAVGSTSAFFSLDVFDVGHGSLSPRVSTAYDLRLKVQALPVEHAEAPQRSGNERGRTASSTDGTLRPLRRDSFIGGRLREPGLPGEYRPT